MQNRCCLFPFFKNAALMSRENESRRIQPWLFPRVHAEEKKGVRGGRFFWGYRPRTGTGEQQGTRARESSYTSLHSFIFFCKVKSWGLVISDVRAAKLCRQLRVLLHFLADVNGEGANSAGVWLTGVTLMQGAWNVFQMHRQNSEIKVVWRLPLPSRQWVWAKMCWTNC